MHLHPDRSELAILTTRATFNTAAAEAADELSIDSLSPAEAAAVEILRCLDADFETQADTAVEGKQGVGGLARALQRRAVEHVRGQSSA